LTATKTTTKNIFEMERYIQGRRERERQREINQKISKIFSTHPKMHFSALKNILGEIACASKILQTESPSLIYMGKFVRGNVFHFSL
jgi:hypothetical protein